MSRLSYVRTIPTASKTWTTGQWWRPHPEETTMTTEDDDLTPEPVPPTDEDEAAEHAGLEDDES